MGHRKSKRILEKIIKRNVGIGLLSKWKEKYAGSAERAREALNNARQLNAQLCRTIELSL